VKLARYDDVRTFCRVDGWARAGDAPGRRTRKHEVWVKELDDGSVLRCVVSKGRGEYSPRMTGWIVRHELKVTQEEFWAAVRDGVAPARPHARETQPQGELLPLGLVRALEAAGHQTSDLRGLTLAEAKRLLKPEQGDEGSGGTPET
jgi:hypothetical protein